MPCPRDGEDGEDDEANRTDDAEDEARARRQKGEPEAGDGLGENVAPALVGGAIIYTLAFFDMLPFAGAGKTGRFVGRRFPDSDPGDDPATAPVPFPGGADPPTDPRVAFEEGTFEEGEITEHSSKGKR